MPATVPLVPALSVRLRRVASKLLTVPFTVIVEPAAVPPALVVSRVTAATLSVVPPVTEIAWPEVTRLAERALVWPSSVSVESVASPPVSVPRTAIVPFEPRSETASLKVTPEAPMVMRPDWFVRPIWISATASLLMARRSVASRLSVPAPLPRPIVVPACWPWSVSVPALLPVIELAPPRKSISSAVIVRPLEPSASVVPAPKETVPPLPVASKSSTTPDPTVTVPPVKEIVSTLSPAWIERLSVTLPAPVLVNEPSMSMLAVAIVSSVLALTLMNPLLLLVAPALKATVGETTVSPPAPMVTRPLKVALVAGCRSMVSALIAFVASVVPVERRSSERFRIAPTVLMIVAPAVPGVRRRIPVPAAPSASTAPSVMFAPAALPPALVGSSSTSPPTSSVPAKLIASPVVTTSEPERISMSEPAPVCVTAPPESRFALVRRPPATVITPLPAVVLAPAVKTVVPVAVWMPVAAEVVTSPVKVVVPAPAIWFTRAALVVPEMLTLFALVIVTSPARLPAAPRLPV